MRVRALGLTVVPASDTARRIYLLVRERRLARWSVERSSDSDSVCTGPKS